MQSIKEKSGRRQKRPRGNPSLHASVLSPITYPESLPISREKETLVSAIRDHQVIVVTGETGSGKTTQLPKMCLEAGRGLSGIIGCTQPRRIAAVTVARRIAEELGEDIGHTVGYKIRFDNRAYRGSLIKIMTDGILLNEAQADPLLSAYDTVIVDEAHERSLNIDFVLGILKHLLAKRPGLKLIITSATIDSAKFSAFFENAPVIEVSGRVFPVEVRYRPPGNELHDSEEATDAEGAVRAVEKLWAERRRGDILIFMPTERDVRETCEMLQGRAKEGEVILPLYSRLTWKEQRRIFQPMDRQKIIVATNIAETSITIPGIGYVIDTGKARIAGYSSRTRTSGLPVKKISRSSADQRKGRCGRLENGICIRLYSEDDYRDRPLFTQPEILRSNLAGVVLKMLSLNIDDIFSFPFIDPPPPKSMRDGLEILQELNAVEYEESRGPKEIRLTGYGRIMARIPLDPRLSRMLIEAEKEGCLEEIIVLAAALSVQDPRERPAEKGEAADAMHALFKDVSSDFLTLLNIWNGYQSQLSSGTSRNKIKKYCTAHFLSFKRMREWQDVTEQIGTILAEQGIKTSKISTGRDYSAYYAAVHRSVLTGYLNNIAVKKEKNLYLATKGREVMLFPGSGLFNKGGSWIVAVEMVETSRIFARSAANIDGSWLESLGGRLCRFSYSSPRWDKRRGEVVADEQVSLFGLVIVPRRIVSYGPRFPEEARKIFIRRALVEGEIGQDLPFLIYNRGLIEQASRMEEKMRKRGFLAGDEDYARFYEERLPLLYNIRSLKKWIKDRGSDNFLRMTEDDILLKPPDAGELALYPNDFAMGNTVLPLTYRFDPGTPQDGVTANIPLHLVAQIGTGRSDWIVPGLLREKVNLMLRGLPKEHRKKLLPLGDTCHIIINEMSESDDDLPHALSAFIQKRFGVAIPRRSWPVNDLPDHVRLRFSVIDGQGKEILAGRDFRALQSEAIGLASSRALQAARLQWERKDITGWDFGDLPECVELRDINGHAGFAYPALVFRKDNIGLCLLQGKNEALALHRKGVGALFALHFREEMRHLKKSLALEGDMKAWAKSLGGHGLIEASLFKCLIGRLLETDVRTRQGFIDRGEVVRKLILPMGQELLRSVAPVLKGYHETATLLSACETSHRANGPALQFIGHLRENANRLVPADFAEIYDANRLMHLPRYLKAIVIAAQRGLLHLEKALAKTGELNSLVDDLDNMIEKLAAFKSDGGGISVDEYRWMIEEYRVSLFAQELKTPFPISRRKLDEKRRELELLL